jgi:4-amino-4-deoxy-L-arabinose transferase-like glycosyltransferase
MAGRIGEAPSRGAGERLAWVSRIQVAFGPVGAVAAALVAAYAATRIWFASDLPYFVDEGSYAVFSDRAAHSVNELFVSLTIGPRVLQTWLGIPLIRLGFEPLTAMRLISVLAGLATVAVVALIARRMGGTPAAVASATGCVALPLLLVHDAIGIIEPLLTLLMAAALYLQIELARRPDVRGAALLGLVLACGVLTKETAWAAVALMPASLLCFDWSPTGRSRRLSKWVQGAGIAVAGAVAAEVAMRSSDYYPALEQLRETPQYTVRSLGDVLDAPFGSAGKTWDVFGPAFTGYVTLPLIAAAIVGAAIGLHRRPRLTAVLLAWFAVPLTASLLFSTAAYPRHLLPLMPPLLVLVAYSFVEVAAWTRRVLPPRIAVPAIVVGVLILLAPAFRLDARVLADPATAKYPGRDDWQYVTGAPAGSQWPAVADAIRRFAAGRRVVVISPTVDPSIARLLLGDDSRYAFVSGDSPLAPQARLALTEERPLLVDAKAVAVMQQGHPRVIARFPRPRGGDVIELSELRPG